jgi:hypothetical protein
MVIVPNASHFTFAERAGREPWSRAVLGFLTDG